jgi:hypothetical protein
MTCRASWIFSLRCRRFLEKLLLLVGIEKFPAETRKYPIVAGWGHWGDWKERVRLTLCVSMYLSLTGSDDDDREYALLKEPMRSAEGNRSRERPRKDNCRRRVQRTLDRMSWRTIISSWFIPNDISYGERPKEKDPDLRIEFKRRV